MMLTTNDVAEVYDIVMSIPGINENVKISLKLSRKNVLLLSNVIEHGLQVKDNGRSSYLLKRVPEETVQELRAFSEECLEKAGLVELNEKLTALNGNK